MNSTTWMQQCRWGVFQHFLADRAGTHDATMLSARAWNARVDAYDVDKVARQLLDLRVPLIGITLGQNSGYYCSPNSAYDRLTCRGLSESRLSRRDLVADIINAVVPHGIRVMVYCPTHAPAHDPVAAELLGCVPPWDATMWSFKPSQFGSHHPRAEDDRLTRFQRNWESILAEWSNRWGTGVSAWWLDGAYFAEKLYASDETPNFKSLAAALRTGNPAALVTFNHGVRLPRLRAESAGVRDYHSGEVDYALPVNGKWHDGSAVWSGPLLDHEQLAVFTFAGSYWGQGPLRFGDDLAAAYTRHVNESGGFMLWDVPFEDDGTFPAEVIRQLSKMPR